MANPSAARIDGRKARSTATRQTVVDALLALLTDGELQPTAPRIAARAGVSLRSVFQHFPDLETLFAAAADRQTARLRAMAHPLPTDGPLHARLSAFVAQRAGLLEALTPVRRAAVLMEPFSAEIARRLSGARAAGRSEVARVFAPELAACTPAERREVVAALAVASSWSTWEPLRAHHGLSVEQARKVMTRLVAALLAPAAGARTTRPAARHRTAPTRRATAH